MPTEALLDGRSRRGARGPAGDRQDEGALLEAVRGFATGPLEWIALTSGWLMVIMACVTSFDVRGAGKFRHAAAVHQAARAGMAFPRRDLLAVDGLLLHDQRASTGSTSFTERMTYRGKAWVELIGCLLLALPYMTLVSYYSIDFVEASYRIGEQSDSTVGLTHRWIIKGIYAAGSLACGVRHPERAVAGDRLPVSVGLPGRKVNLQIGTVITEV